MEFEDRLCWNGWFRNFFYASNLGRNNSIWLVPKALKSKVKITLAQSGEVEKKIDYSKYGSVPKFSFSLNVTQFQGQKN